MKRSLQCLQALYEKWSVEINEEKSAMIHMHEENRCMQIDVLTLSILVRMKSLWFPLKYLGCMVDEFLDCSSMVEYRVKLGSQALGAWLRKCREVSGRGKW